MILPVLLSHILLDSARMLEQMETAKTLNPQGLSLYRGRSEENLAMVAPYIFTYKDGEEFSFWLAKGWGNSWGIYLYSEASFDELHHHFRKFLLVKTEEGQELYFRFYDPRVLRVFLPTCDEEQLREFFGPVNYFMMEDEDPSQAIVFYRKEGKLGSYTLPVESLEKILNNDNSSLSG
ncbi:hypothetical protein BH23BAC1_BH23BAC1_25340 [soil metagenome]